MDASGQREEKLCGESKCIKGRDGRSRTKEGKAVR